MAWVIPGVPGCRVAVLLAITVIPVTLGIVAPAQAGDGDAHG